MSATDQSDREVAGEFKRLQDDVRTRKGNTRAWGADALTEFAESTDLADRLLAALEREERLLKKLRRVRTAIAVETRTIGNTQWNGRDIPADETDDTEIKWWSIEGLDIRDCDDIWIRGWQQMLSFVKNQIDMRLEAEEVEAGEPVSITFQLQTGKLSEYLEVVEGELP